MAGTPAGPSSNNREKSVPPISVKSKKAYRQEALIVFLAFFTIGVWVAGLIPAVYESEAMLEISEKAPSTFAKRLPGLFLHRKRLEELAREFVLTGKSVRAEELEAAMAQMRLELSVWLRDKDALVVACQAPNPLQARRICERLTQSTLASLAPEEEGLLQITSPASLPSGPIKPSRPLIAFVGAIFAAVFALAWYLVQNARRKKVLRVVVSEPPPAHSDKRNSSSAPAPRDSSPSATPLPPRETPAVEPIPFTDPPPARRPAVESPDARVIVEATGFSESTLSLGLETTLIRPTSGKTVEAESVEIGSWSSEPRPRHAAEAEPQTALAIVPRENSVVSIVDVPPGWRPHVALNAPRLKEGMRTLRDEIARRFPKRKCAIGVTSQDVSAETSKSKVAAQLALILSQNHERVLLVEANFHAPSVHEWLNLDVPFSIGFSQQIHERLEANGERPWNVLRCAPTLHVLAESLFRSPGVLVSRAFSEAISELQTVYDVLILDGPISQSTSEVDSRAFDAAVNGLVLVAEPGEPGKPIDPEKLGIADERLVAIVSTDVTAS